MRAVIASRVDRQPPALGLSCRRSEEFRATRVLPPPRFVPLARALPFRCPAQISGRVRAELTLAQPIWPGLGRPLHLQSTDSPDQAALRASAQSRLATELRSIQPREALDRECVGRGSASRHRHFSTTERYYIQTNDLKASRRFNEIPARQGLLGG